MGRTKQAPTQAVVIRYPAELWAEFLLLHPEFQSPQGGLRYGSLKSYMSGILRKDLENTKSQIRMAALANTTTDSTTT